MRGDCNEDLIISLADVNYLLNYIAGNDGYIVSKYIGDINNDGKISLADVNILLNYIADNKKYIFDKIPYNEEYYLFDGNNINNLLANSTANFYKIENNELIFNLAGQLMTEDVFKNFELETEVKLEKGGNSGIFYLTKEFSTNYGPEYQIVDNENHINGNNIKTTFGAVYDLIGSDIDYSKPYGEFNKIKIICRNNIISHYVNDIKILEYNLFSEEFRNLIKDSKFTETIFGKNDYGKIVLQGKHGNGPVTFKKIII